MNEKQTSLGPTVAQQDRAMERLKARIAERDKARGRPLTDEERLQNLAHAITRCDKCDNGVQLDWMFCAWCGERLQDDEV